MATTTTSLSGVAALDQLTTSTSAMENLTAACQGILDTQMAPSPSPWFGALSAELAQAKALATEWQQEHAGRVRSDLLSCILHCGQSFQASRDAVNQLFGLAPQDLARAKEGLQAQFEQLEQQTRMISSGVSAYEAGLRDWGQRLEQVHGQLAATVHQVQSEEANLQAQIASLNSTIGAMQAEIIQDRQAIAHAKAERDRGIVKTIFGVLFAPFTGGLSLILAGIGVSSIVEAESKVSAMEQTIASYQSRIIADQQHLNQDQTQLVTLQGLTFSAGIALSDIEFGAQMLDQVRTSWDAFAQEMAGVTAKIVHAETAEAVVVEQAWWGAACREWDLVVAGLGDLLAEPVSSRSVPCTSCDVPVIKIVPVSSHPPLPAELKMTVLADPNQLQPSESAPVLSWGPYTYWVASYVDNRVAMDFLGFDAQGRLVKQVARTGARYPWKLVLVDGAKSLQCTGQAEQQVTVTLAELAVG